MREADAGPISIELLRPPAGVADNDLHGNALENYTGRLAARLVDQDPTRSR
jgi:hypothetical protein